MSSTVFKRAMVAGINLGLEKKGHITWPNAEIAEREIVKVADSLAGPDILPAGGLEQASAVKIANALVKTAKAYAAAGHKPSAEYAQGVKTASSAAIKDVAVDTAAYLMDKIAAESMIMAGGEHPNTLPDAAKTDPIAKLDLHNRPVGAYAVAPGATTLPQGGVVGAEHAHPQAPATSPALNSSVSKKVASDAELIQLGLDNTPAQHKTAAIAALTGADAALRTRVTSGLRDAGRAKLAALAKRAMDPQAILAMLAQPQGHPEVEGKIDPQTAALIMQILQENGLGDAGAGGAGAPIGMPGMPGGAGEPPCPPGMPGCAPDSMGAPPPESMGPPGGGAPAEGPPAEKKDKDDKKDEPKSEKDAMLAYLAKVAEGASLTGVGENTLASAAKTDSVAKLDQTNRPEGSYEVAQGKTDMPNAGHIGAKQDVADKPTHPDTTPEREQAKSAAVVEYVARATKVAAEWLPKLPASMPAAEKLAKIKALTGPTPDEQAELVRLATG